MVKMNLMILTACFYLQLLMKVSSIPLQVGIKGASSRKKDIPRNEIRRRKRSSHTYNAYLYTRHTRRFVRITEKEINALAHKGDKYAELLLTKLGFEGQHSIKGKASNKYICLNSKGRVILKDSYNARQCMFRLVKSDTSKGYTTFRSDHNEDWHLGFKKNGTVRHAHKTRHNHHAAWLMLRYPKKRS